MTANPAPVKTRVRALRDADLDRLVEIDRLHVGRSRRRFLEKRLGMHAADPAEFLQFGAEVDGRLAGFELSSRLVIERPVAVPFDENPDEI